MSSVVPIKPPNPRLENIWPFITINILARAQHKLCIMLELSKAGVDVDLCFGSITDPRQIYILAKLTDGSPLELLKMMAELPRIDLFTPLWRALSVGVGSKEIEKIIHIPQGQKGPLSDKEVDALAGCQFVSAPAPGSISEVIPHKTGPHTEREVMSWRFHGAHIVSEHDLYRRIDEGVALSKLIGALRTGIETYRNKYGFIDHDSCMLEASNSAFFKRRLALKNKPLTD